jgi:hypothetical protein
VNSSILKIVIAFVAGITLALVYMHMQERRVLAPAIGSQTEASLSAASQTPKSTQTSDPKTLSEHRPNVASSGAHRVAKRKQESRPAKPEAVKQEPGLVVADNPMPPAPVLPPSALRPSNLAPTHAPIQEPTSAMTDVQSALPIPQAPHIVQIPSGTTLAIRLTEALSSDHNYVGDTFHGVLAQQLVLDGFIIADRESKVLGRVIAAQSAGRVKGLSNLSVTLTEINTTDGQRIPVETSSVDRQGQKSTGSDTAKVAGGAALGAIIGALGSGGKGAAIGAGAGGAAGTGVVLATRGKSATLPSESQLAFVLEKPVTITEQIHH